MKPSFKLPSFYLWLIFTLSLLHLVILSSVARSQGLILGALPVAYGLHLWLNRKQWSNSNQIVLPLIIITLTTATIASHLINIVPLEGNSEIQNRYKQLQITFLHTLPFIIVWMAKKPKLRNALPIIGLTLQLLPPYSTSMLYTFQAPMYGRIVALLYLSLFIYRRPVRLIFLLPAIVALPSLFYGHSPGNTIDHIVTWSIFGITASIISQSRNKIRTVLIFFILILSILHSLFSFKYHALSAVNNNVMTIHAETVILISLIMIFASTFSLQKKVVISFLLFLFYITFAIRIGAETSAYVIFISACLFYSIIIIHFQFTKKSQILLYSGLVLGTVIVFIAAIFYIIQFNYSHSIASRLLIWKTILAGIASNPQSLLFGNGDFGPYHLFPFRHLQSNLNPNELNTLSKEPYLVSTHPHNDYLAIIYSGGIVLFLIMVFLSIQMFKNTKATNNNKINPIFLTAIVSAFFATLLFHGLTEPFTTGATTGFLFFLMYALAQSYTIRNQKKPNNNENSSLLNIKIINSIALISAVYFLALSTLQLPVTKLWKQNGELFFALRQTTSLPKLIEISEKQKNQLQQALPRLLLLTKLAPWESDYYRQTGDIQLLRFLSEPTLNNQKVNSLQSAALMNYCHAFALRSSPIHYAMIKRLSPNLEQACSGIHLRQSLTGYDPQHVLDLPNSDGLPLF